MFYCLLYERYGNMNFKKVLCLNLALVSIFSGTFTVTANQAEPTHMEESVQQAGLMATVTKTYDKITYELDESTGTATVIGIDENKVAIELRDTIGNTYSSADNAYKSYKITAIADGVGNGHQKLTRVKLDNAKNLEYIGENCFAYCPVLERVDFPTSVSLLEYVGSYAFYCCSELEAVNYTKSQEALTYVGSCVFGVTPYMYFQTDEFVMFGNALLKYNGYSENVVLPENTAIIADAFFGKEIVSIDLGSVEYIGDNAFYNCKKLESVVLPSTCKKVGDMAFAGCSSLESVEYLGNLESVGYCCFANCPSLLSFTYGGTGKSTLSDIGECAFWNDKKLYAIEVGVIDSVNVGTFWNCFNAPTQSGNIYSYQLPATVNIIAEGSFLNYSLSYIGIPSDITAIASTAFGTTGSTKYVVHKGTNIEKYFKDSGYGYVNYGDVNTDDKIDAKDIKRVAEIIATNLAKNSSKQDVLNYDSGKGIIADSNGDGSITTRDLYEIFSSIKAEYEKEKAAE